MKVTIPVDTQSLDGVVAENFGRAANFLFYDTETKSVDYLDNSAVMSAGGAGIKAAQAVVDAGAQALIAPRCGENAAKVLQAAGVKLFQSAGGTAQENLDALAAGALADLSDIHAGFHHHG